MHLKPVGKPPGRLFSDPKERNHEQVASELPDESMMRTMSRVASFPHALVLEAGIVRFGKG